MSTLSTNRSIAERDISTGRCQMGLAWIGDLGLSSILWNLFRGANKYLINATAPITVTLPPTGTANSQAQPGYWTIITNKGNFNITVENSSANPVTIISPGRSVQFVSDTTVVLGWTLQFQTPTNLQEAYNASDIADPQILLSNTFGGLKIGDSPSAALELLSVRNNSNTLTYFNVGNGASPVDSPFVGLFGGTSSATNCFVIGPTSSSAANSVILTDSSAVPVNNLANSLNKTFTGGEVSYGGIVREGTTLTSPNERIAWFSSDVVTTSVTPISTGITLLPNTTYSLSTEIYGRDSDPTSEVSVIHELRGLVTVLLGAPTLVNTMIRTIGTPGFTVPSNATFSFSGSVLEISINAPDNIVGANLITRGFLSLKAVTVS